MLVSEVQEGLLVIHPDYGIGVVTVCLHETLGLRCEVAFDKDGYPWFVDFFDSYGGTVNFDLYKGD